MHQGPCGLWQKGIVSQYLLPDCRLYACYEDIERLQAIAMSAEDFRAGLFAAVPYLVVELKDRSRQCSFRN